MSKETKRPREMDLNLIFSSHSSHLVQHWIGSMTRRQPIVAPSQHQLQPALWTQCSQSVSRRQESKVEPVSTSASNSTAKNPTKAIDLCRSIKWEGRVRRVTLTATEEKLKPNFFSSTWTKIFWFFQICKIKCLELSNVIKRSFLFFWCPLHKSTNVYCLVSQNSSLTKSVSVERYS